MRDIFMPPEKDLSGESAMCDFCGKENKVGYMRGAPPGGLVIGTVAGAIWACDGCDKKYNAAEIDIALAVKTNIRNNLVKFLNQELYCVSTETQEEIKVWVKELSKIIKKGEK